MADCPKCENKSTLKSHQREGVWYCEHCKQPFKMLAQPHVDGCSTANNGCMCICHRVPGVLHCVPCC